MTRVVDAEEAHLAAILRAADFLGRRVLEVGSAERRLLRENVSLEVARAEEIEVPPHSVDLVFFSWSHC